MQRDGPCRSAGIDATEIRGRVVDMNELPGVAVSAQSTGPGRGRRRCLAAGQRAGGRLLRVRADTVARPWRAGCQRPRPRRRRQTVTEVTPAGTLPTTHRSPGSDTTRTSAAAAIRASPLNSPATVCNHRRLHETVLMPSLTAGMGGTRDRAARAQARVVCVDVGDHVRGRVLVF